MEYNKRTKSRINWVDSILSVSFPLLFIILLGLVIWGNVLDWSKLKPGPTYGFVSTKRLDILEGVFLLYLGLVLVSAYVFTRACSFFEFVIDISQGKRRTKNPVILICSIVAVVLGIATLIHVSM
jgi:cytochrome bd-type quinol oxidase subunit 2